MKLFKKTKQNKGFTLVEILLVVGFIALAGIGIYTIYAKVQVSAQANAESRNLDTLRAGVKTLYGGRANYTGLTNTVLNNARVTPDSMRTPGDAASITNTFGGQATVMPQDLNGTANGFRITYPSVPSAVCSKLVTSAGVQFQQVAINNVIVKGFGTNQPIDVAGAAEACNANDVVSIIFDSL